MSILSSLSQVAKYLGKVTARIRGWFSAPFNPNSATGSHADETLAWLRTKFAEDIKRNFAESRDPDGNAWKPLKYRQGKPLILTGLMMNSAYLAAQNVMVRGHEILASLSQPKYWVYQNYGTRTIPKREFFGPRPDTVQQLADRMGADLAAGLTRDEIM